MADVPSRRTTTNSSTNPAGLPKTTNWWGAFVIGLAGTILVTGIAPVMVTELGAASVPVIVVHHGHRLHRVPVARRALGDDARPLRRPAVLRVPGLQGPLAAVRRARERLHGLGVLARLVPGGAAEHDPGVVLHRRPLPALDRRLHADPHPDRLVDARRSRSAASCCSRSPPCWGCGSGRCSRPRSRCCR